MTEILQQAVLGLGAGASIAIAGLGIVQIARGSGVLNFAHGAFALASAEVFVWAWSDHGVPLVPSALLAVGLAALLGAATHLVVMRPLARASPLVRIIATIGVLQVVQQATLLVFGGESRAFVGSFLPTGAFDLGGVAVPRSSLVLVAVAAVLGLGLWVTMRSTSFGLTTQAVSESALITRSLGRSPDHVAAASWTLGAALAGVAGVLIVPVGGLSVGTILLLAVPAFAAAVIGSFRSYLLTIVGAFAIAVGQSVYTFEAVRNDWPAGVAPALPFLVVVLVLAARSSAIPARDHVAARLPQVARALPSWRWAAGLGVLGVVGALAASEGLANALTTTFLTAIVGLSLVVITGLSGQISFGQFAIAGIGALAAARCSDLLGWPFELCIVAGVLAAALCGAIFGLPALRTRGPALAVVTIGLALAVEQGLLADSDLTGGFNGATPVDRPRLLGLPVDAVDHPQRYAALAVAAFAILALAVGLLRAGPLGRRMLAVRGNERAAAAIGVPVARTRLVAFVLGSAIAGFGGVLIAFRFDAVQYGQFALFRSLELVTVVLIGGIGFVLGPLVGALVVPGGVLEHLASGAGDLERWLVLGAGALLVVTLVVAPDGLVPLVARRLRRWRGGRAGPTATVERAEQRVIPPPPADRDGGGPVPTAAPAGAVAAPRPISVDPRRQGGRPGGDWAAARRRLEVQGLDVRFGAVQAVRGVDLVVEPGRVTGLVGSNGAGKTTLIDAVSGFVRGRAGRILLGELEVTGMPTHRRAAHGIGRCFQSLELFEDLDVAGNLLVAAEAASPHPLQIRRRSGLGASSRALVEELRLDEVLDAMPRELPHGIRRLVGVARALVARPSVLLLDEPAAGLDPAETDHLGSVIRRVADAGVGVLLVEHDVELVVAVSDEVFVMDDGSVIFRGDPGDMAHDPAVRLAYLGNDEAAAAAP